MKKRITEEQIIAILKEAEAGVKVIYLVGGEEKGGLLTLCHLKKV